VQYGLKKIGCCCGVVLRLLVARLLVLQLTLDLAHAGAHCHAAAGDSWADVQA
jgi:hypothetical protein